MKVSGITANKVVNLYGDSKRHIEKKQPDSKKDSIEISSVGKSLSSYMLNNDFQMSSNKIEALRNEVSSGTYKRDSKLVAKRIIDIMRNREV